MLVFYQFRNKITKKTARMQKIQHERKKSAMLHTVYPNTSFINFANNATCSLVGSILFFPDLNCFAAENIQKDLKATVSVRL